MDGPTGVNYPLAPIAGNPVSLAVTDTVALFVIPSWLRGRRCRLTMRGAKAAIIFGDSTVVAVYAQNNTVDGSGNITAHAGVGDALDDAVSVEYTIPADTAVTHFSVDCVASGSGRLIISPIGF